MFVNLRLISLPKRSVGVTEVDLITEFLKSEKLKEYSLSSQSHKISNSVSESGF